MPGGCRTVDHKFRDLSIRAKQKMEPIVSFLVVVPDVVFRVLRG